MADEATKPCEIPKSSPLYKLFRYQKKIANVFVVTGNIYDFHPMEDGRFGLPHRAMTSSVSSGFDIFVTYDRGSGWSFLDRASRSKAEVIISAARAPQSNEYTDGLNNAGVKPNFAAEPPGAFAEFDILLNENETKVCIVIDYVEAILSQREGWKSSDVDTLAVRVLKWARLLPAKKAHKLVVLMGDVGNLHPALKEPTSRIEFIDLPFPDRINREQYIRRWAEYNGAAEVLEPDVKQLAGATAALTNVDIEDILLPYKKGSNPNKERIDFSLVQEKKNEIMRKSFNDVIEVKTPQFGKSAVGSLDFIVDALLRDVVAPMKAGDKLYTPMGVLFMGSPGTGKSITAEATAYEAKMTYIVLRMSRILDMWLGSSQRNFAKAKAVIKANTPCIVFVDELESFLPRRGSFDGTSGTMSNIIQEFLEFTSDTSHRGDVCFLAATNRPDLLDEAVKRAGRFDWKVCFPPPETPEERKGILLALQSKLEIPFKDSKNKLDEVARKTELFMGADLEHIWIKACRIARDKVTIGKREEFWVGGGDLLEASDLIQPSVDPNVVRYLTALAMNEVTDLSLMPPKVRERYNRDEQAKIIEEGKIKHARWEG